MDSTHVIALHKLRQLWKEAEADEDRYNRFAQPMAYLVNGGYGCEKTPDGEVFTGNGVRVTVPSSCVEWLGDVKVDTSPPKWMRNSFQRLKAVLESEERGASDVELTPELAEALLQIVNAPPGAELLEQGTEEATPYIAGSF
jgi:hypothetical protein